MILVADPNQTFSRPSVAPSDQIALISHLQFARLSKKQDRIGMSDQNRRIERERKGKSGRRTARGREDQGEQFSRRGALDSLPRSADL